jgi:tellurite resistance protein TehA-like permease
MRSRSASAYLSLMVGVATGVFVLSIARTLYYFAIDRQPEMSPMMFIVFAPVVALPFMFVAAVAEFVARRLMPRLKQSRKQSSRSWSFLIGASYTSPLFGLIDARLLVLCLLINPVVAHVLLARRERADAVDRALS